MNDQVLILLPSKIIVNRRSMCMALMVSDVKSSFEEIVFGSFDSDGVIDGNGVGSDDFIPIDEAIVMTGHLLRDRSWSSWVITDDSSAYRIHAIVYQ